MGEVCRLMWRLVWSPKASSKCLISQAVAVVEVKICKGVCACAKVVGEGPEAIAGFVGADNPASASPARADAR